MAIKYSRVPVSLPTAGTLDVTVPGFGTCIGAIAIFTNVTAAGGSTTADAVFGFGLTDGTTHRCVSIAEGHNLTISNSCRSASTAFIDVVRVDSTSQIAYNASIITDGIQLSIASGSTGASRLAVILLIGATGSEQAKCGTFTGVFDGSTSSVTGVGFEPDVLFSGFNGQDVGVIANSAVISYGVALNKVGIPQKSTLVTQFDNQGATVNSKRMSNRLASYGLSGFAYGELEVTGFNSDGFDLTWHEEEPSATARYCHYLAIDTGGADAEILDLTFPSSGNYSQPTSFESTAALVSIAMPSSALGTYVQDGTCATNMFGIMDSSGGRNMYYASSGGANISAAQSYVTDSVGALNENTPTAVQWSFSFALTASTWDFTANTSPPSSVAAWGLNLGVGGDSPEPEPGTLDAESGNYTYTGSDVDFTVSGGETETGWLYPSAVAEGTGTEPSSSLSNLFTEASSAATFDMAWNDTCKQMLQTGYGAAVPAGATITGVAVEVSRYANKTTYVDRDCRLIVSGVASGDDKGVDQSIPTAQGTLALGSDSDLWGNALTPEIVNSPDFGFLYQSANVNQVGSFYTFYCRINIFYTPGSGLNAESGDYTFTGGEVDFRLTPVPLLAESGSYTYIGSDVSFDLGMYLNCSQGAYTATGGVAGFVIGGGVQTVDAYFDSVVSVAAESNAIADISADVTASVAFGDSLQIVAAVEAVITETTGLGSSFTGEVEAAGSIQTFFTTTTVHSAQVSAQAEAIAAIEIDQALAVSVIADAITDAGFEVGHLVDVTFTGSKISGQMVTPDSRTFVVNAEIRSFKVTS